MTQPTREDVDRMPGPVLLEFGASWCGHCQTMQPGLASIERNYPGVRHIIIEDGPGLPLGRSFRVKLWPTLVFLRDGKVVSQLVRPSTAEIAKSFEARRVQSFVGEALDDGPLQFRLLHAAQHFAIMGC